MVHSSTRRGSMLSAIIATHESERTLVPTLAALVPGATAGLLSEVIVADANSKDATSEIADFAGCRFINSQEPLGTRFKSAAQSTRTPWLLFLHAGTMPEPGWVDDVGEFMESFDKADNGLGAAVFSPTGAVNSFRPALSDVLSLLRARFSRPRPEQGLLITRRHYDRLGGHQDVAQTEAALLRKIGSRRIAVLAARAKPPR
jgi:glycosyltransferase involved in cell wall biosynthesis